MPSIYIVAMPLRAKRLSKNVPMDATKANASRHPSSPQRNAHEIRAFPIRLCSPAIQKQENIPKRLVNSVAALTHAVLHRLKRVQKTRAKTRRHCSCAISIRARKPNAFAPRGAKMALANPTIPASPVSKMRAKTPSRSMHAIRRR